MKPRTKREKEFAEFVLKGALTRLALMFYASRETYTGEQVSEILLTAWHGYQQANTPEALPEGTPALGDGNG